MTGDAQEKIECENNRSGARVQDPQDIITLRATILLLSKSRLDLETLK